MHEIPSVNVLIVLSLKSLHELVINQKKSPRIK